MTLALHGLQVSRGVTIGRAVVLASARLDVAHYFVEPGSEEREVDRLRAARSVVLDEMNAVKDDLPADTPAEVAALIEVHMMLLDDSTLRQDTARWIRERRYNAEWALTAQLDVLVRQFDEMDDAYLRERKHDVEQVVERLLRALRAQGRAAQAAQPDQEQFYRTGAFKLDPTPLVLVAHDIAPGDMLQFKRGLFGGFVTDTGGPTSHTAIVARSLDIPAVVGAREATRLIRQDDTLVIDADAGVVLVAPDERIRTHYERRQREIAGMRRKLTQLRDVAAVTLDGVAIDLQANIELPEDAYTALQAGADGVGLFRSEFLFMNRAELPGEDEQFEAYRAALRAMSGKPVTIRTLDIGADKPLDAREAGDAQRHTPNPALGLRAIRYSLAQPAMFLTQLRALLRAAAAVPGSLRILVPMLAHDSEIRQTYAHLTEAREQLLAEGVEVPPVPVGAMIEVPAAALTLPLFVGAFDFLSIGTNDLIQYTLAIDRTDEAVASLYDALHPAVLRLIRDTIAAGQAAGVPVSLCGEMAGELRYTALLLGLGLRSFSMHPNEILAVKEVVRQSTVAALRDAAERLCDAQTPARRLELLRGLRCID